MQNKDRTKILGGDKKEFFYPGGLKYKPQTVLAESQEEADDIYEQTRQTVELLSTNEPKENL